MRDGRKKILTGAAPRSDIDAFLKRFQAKIVVVSGRDAGEGYSLDRARTVLGRGPGVDAVFKNAAMSRQHAALEYTDDGFRIQDLGSTNGIYLHGQRVQAGDLGNGDRFEIGGQEFQLVIEEREDTPVTYDLSPEA